MLLSLPHLPPIVWLAALWQSRGTVYLEAHEHYQKGSYRNRCQIAGPNGVQRLSVPLAKGKNSQMPMRDVRIAYDEPWQQVHWRSIYTAYGNAPYFEHYAPGLEPFFQKKYVFLFDLNLELLLFITGKMGWTGQLEHTAVFFPPDTENPADFRALVASKETEWPHWFQPAPYSQVFAEKHGFLPNLSALDLLFCRGKQSGAVLEQSVRHFPNTSSDPL